jgi:hypothetical protein
MKKITIIIIIFFLAIQTFSQNRLKEVKFDNPLQQDFVVQIINSENNIVLRELKIFHVKKDWEKEKLNHPVYVMQQRFKIDCPEGTKLRYRVKCNQGFSKAHKLRKNNLFTWNKVMSETELKEVSLW